MSQIHSSLVSTTKKFIFGDNNNEAEKRSLTHTTFSPHKLEKPSPMKHGCLLPSQKGRQHETINK
jgi:hypothetical protein